MIVATPAGSTAYASSAGGLILPRGTPSFLIAPLAPFEPHGIRPIIYPDDEKVAIATTRMRSETCVAVHVDGIALIESTNTDVAITAVRAAHGVTLLIADEYLAEWQDQTYLAQGFTQVKV